MFLKSCYTHTYKYVPGLFLPTKPKYLLPSPIQKNFAIPGIREQTSDQNDQRDVGIRTGGER